MFKLRVDIMIWIAFTVQVFLASVDTSFLFSLSNVVVIIEVALKD